MLAQPLPATDRVPADLTRIEREELVLLLEERERRMARRLFYSFHQDEDQVWLGPDNDEFDHGATIYSRHKYPRHLEFFAAGATHRERCFMAGNRTSKTLGGGAYEMTCHSTGLYPDWWEGRRFTRPIRAWASGITYKDTRDIVQTKLVGIVEGRGPGRYITGMGMIPGELIGDVTWNGSVANLIDTVHVRHVTGGWSIVGFKAYEQGRKSFQGVSQHVIWFDEEPPADVYGEAVIRTGTTHGMIFITFTPLSGMSDVVMSFLPAEYRPAA